jgi:hypothetical protein
MSILRYAAIFGVAATLAACGGAPANLVPTVNPLADQMNETPAPNDAAPTTAPTQAVQVDASAELRQASDPSSLEAGTFEVEIEIEQGTVVLTPVPPVDDETDYIVGDYTPADDIFKTYTVSFDLYERHNEIWSYSRVQIRLPEGSGPGTYDVETSAMLMEDGKIGAYVDNFTDDDINDYVFYDQFEGTITITEIDDERASGSFSFVARDDEGHTANVSGAFNGIGDGHTWINTGSY